MCPDDVTQPSNEITKLRDLGWREMALRWLFSQGAVTVMLFAILIGMYYKVPLILESQEAERKATREEFRGQVKEAREDFKTTLKEQRADFMSAIKDLTDAIEGKK